MALGLPASPSPNPGEMANKSEQKKAASSHGSLAGRL